MLIEIGTRWPSSLVLAEAELALHRWREDVARLRAYGWGERRRAAFATLVDRLRSHHDAFSTLKGIKVGTVPVEGSARKAAHVWLDRARSILESAELEHEGASAALEAIPAASETSSTETIAAVRAALAQLRTLRQVLDAEAATDEFFTAGEAAAFTLEAAVAGPDAAAIDTSEHQDELDALDGEIYLTVRGLNHAGVRLFQADGNTARVERYAFQFLVTFARDEPRPPSTIPPGGSSVTTVQILPTRVPAG
jgi:hypothetical protein